MVNVYYLKIDFWGKMEFGKIKIYLHSKL